MWHFRHAHMNRSITTTTTGYKRLLPRPRLHNGLGRCPLLQVQIQCCAHQVQQSRPSGHSFFCEVVEGVRCQHSTVYCFFWLKGVVKQLLWWSQGSKTIGYVVGNDWRMCVGQDVANRLFQKQLQWLVQPCAMALHVPPLQWTLCRKRASAVFILKHAKRNSSGRCSEAIWVWFPWDRSLHQEMLTIFRIILFSCQEDQNAQFRVAAGACPQLFNSLLIGNLKSLNLLDTDIIQTEFHNMPGNSNVHWSRRQSRWLLLRLWIFC